MTTPTVSDPVVVDSSGWLEYITSDSNAELFAPYLEGERPVLVPTIVLYEVRKILLQRQPKTVADLFVSQALRRAFQRLTASHFDLAQIAGRRSALTRMGRADKLRVSPSR